MRVNGLANVIREDLLLMEGVRKVSLSRRGMAIFSAGTPANHIYFLDSGLIKIEKATDINKDLVLGVIAPGELFGEQALAGECAFSVSAKVLDVGVAYSVPTETFFRFCERRPEVWRLLTQYMVARKSELERKIEHLCHSDVRQRLLIYLGELAKISNASDVVPQIIHISQNELASLVGATRETTSTTLNMLARQGLIELSHRQILIRSLDSLRDAVEDAPSARTTAAGVPQM